MSSIADPIYAKTTDVNHKKKWKKGAISIELAPFSH